MTDRQDPAPMGAAEYVNTRNVAYVVACLIRGQRFDEAIRRLDHADTVAPYTDPTTWLQKRDAAAEDRTVLQAFADLQTRLAPLYARLEADDNSAKAVGTVGDLVELVEKKRG